MSLLLTCSSTFIIASSQLVSACPGGRPTLQKLRRVRHQDNYIARGCQWKKSTDFNKKFLYSSLSRSACILFNPPRAALGAAASLRDNHCMCLFIYLGSVIVNHILHESPTRGTSVKEYLLFLNYTMIVAINCKTKTINPPNPPQVALISIIYVKIGCYLHVHIHIPKVNVEMLKC